MDDATQQVMDALTAADEPLSASMIVSRTGLDRKVVDKAMKALKTAGAIESPQRCFWQPTS